MRIEDKDFVSRNMEDQFLSGWPEDANWVLTSAAEIEENYMVSGPLPLEPDNSSSATFQVGGFPFWHALDTETADDKAGSVSKNHSQAEKRRRDRINSQLGRLRKLIPKADKLDKAALLGSVIDHVKELKRKATQVAKSATIPTDVDEVTVDHCKLPRQNAGQERVHGGDIPLIRASLSCDDRPELFPELIGVIRGLKLTVVAADIASVGGRIKSILVLRNSRDNKDVVSLGTVKQSLGVVLSRIAASSMPCNYRARSKRQRFFLPSYNQSQ